MLYLFVGILVLVGLLLLFGKWLKNVQPTNVEVEEDLIELKEKIALFKGGLMPWSAGISTNEADQIIEKANTRIGSGVLLSSLAEPVLAYAFKKYIGPGKNTVMYILTHQQEYVFRRTTKGTEVTVNGQKIGLIRDNGTFYDLKNRAQGSVKKDTFNAINKIYIEDKEVAKIALPTSNKIEVVEITGKEIDPTQQQIIKMLTINALINPS
jgi:hypothetical protein